MRARTLSRLTLTLEGYRPPTLNRLLQRHWSVVYQEKRRAIRALLSAIERSLSDPSTPTTWRDRLNLSRTRLLEAVSFMGMRRKKSRSGGRKSASLITPKKNVLSQFCTLSGPEKIRTEIGTRQPTKSPHNPKTEGK
jgi:hypothetical protein